MNFQIVKTQKGFALASMLFLIPILVGVAWLVAQFSILIQKQQNLMHICRERLLKTQSIGAQKIHELFLLNPSVIALRVELKAAQLALATALAGAQPEAVAAAEEWIESIQARQTNLQTQQQSILSIGKIQMNLEIEKAHIDQSLELMRRPEPLWQMQIDHEKKPAPHLALQENRDDQGPPAYSLSENFSKDQSLQWQWEEHWESTDINHFKLKWRQQCAATIENKDEALEPRIIMAKY